VVAIFARNAATEALAQLNGLAGCIAEDGEGGVHSGTGLGQAVFVTLSPDGTKYRGPGVTRGPRWLSIYLSK